MAGRAILLSALHALPADRIDALGLVAFQVHLPDATDGADADGLLAIRTAAGVLAGFEIAAGDLFAHWDGGLFSLAAPDLCVAALAQVAERFVRDFRAGAGAAGASGRWLDAAQRRRAARRWRGDRRSAARRCHADLRAGRRVRTGKHPRPRCQRRGAANAGGS